MTRPFLGGAMAAILLVAAAAPAQAQRAGGAVRAVRADLADLAAGRYRGDVVSDPRGAAQAVVRVTVAKVGPNRVRVTSDPARLPAFTAQLVRTMGTVRNAGGAEAFLLDPSKSPRTLTVTVDGVSWAGVRE